MPPTKSQLIEDYFNLNLTHQEIAEKYGYKTRQVVSRWFKTYQIESKCKKELKKENDLKRLTIPSKEDLTNLYLNNSITEISKKLNLSRSLLSKLMKEYEIKTKYFKYYIDENQLKEDLNLISLKEIEIKYDYPIEELKRRKLTKINLPTIRYSIDRIKVIISLYDTNNQGFSKQIINDDSNVYESILFHTKNHKLKSDKITEKIYRLLNNYDENYIPICKETGEILKFYTIKKGYGNSQLNLTRKGFTLSYNFSCHSNVSQKLFWDIYNQLEVKQKNNTEFAQLNKERKIILNENINIKNLNKYHFSLDFCLGDKNIEFDGEYWHSLDNIKEKDIQRDKYLSSIGYKILRIAERNYYTNPKETLNKCIEFLNS